jgi:parvulin-like peptidyl-prolyl isomerase
MRKELQEKLEEEYERFIEFGALLNRQMRKYLVQYLENKLAPDKYVIPELNDQYFQYFKKALDQLFAVNHLIPTLQNNDHISYQLVLDTLYWLRKTYKKIRAKHPYTDEEDRLGGWSVTPIHIFVKRWY